jgi:predicted RecB family nuclease
LQLIDGQPVFSATDLVGYLACEHLTALDRAALAGMVQRPEREDPELELIRRRGEQHEKRYLEELEAGGRRVVRVERRPGEESGDQVRRQATETQAAMRDGAEVVYQATFFDGRWIGYADFLLRVETDDPAGASVWGPYHYEVADTKLARHVKAGAVLQMCSYVDQLERLQGVRPRRMHVVLGGGEHPTETLRVDDFMAYYRAAKSRFESAVLGSDVAPVPAPSYPPAATYPEPVEHCDVCRWSELCAKRRRDDDHLSLVAGITARQRKALAGRGIKTLTALAGSPMPFEPALDGASAASTERVREQARIQLEGRGLKPPLHEVLLPKAGEPIDRERGLATLPEPDEGDLFFDIEGDPYAFDGIDYLFGILDTGGTFTSFWSFDPNRPEEIDLAGEKAAFEAMIDFISDRRRRFPRMHVYHYAAYEPSAMKRLMGRHATREEEVDQLLRGGVMVDLYRAVRQGLRASVESYSIKKLEDMYGFAREVDLRDAGSSIVAFEEWLELGEGDRPTSGILERIERYNRDDVVSNARLRDWLETLRDELAQRSGQEVPRPAERQAEAPDALTAAAAEVQAVADRLTAGVPPDRTDATDEQPASWLLAQLLSWHRRESKSTFWDFFRRVGMTPEELVEEDGAIGQLELVSIGAPYLPTPRAKLLRRRAVYRFPPQEHRDIRDRSELFDPRLSQEHAGESPWEAWKLDVEIGAIDDQQGTIEIIWKTDGEPRHPEAIVALNRIPDKPLPQALMRLGTFVADNGIDGDGPWRAVRDLLMRRPPRCDQGPSEILQRPGEDELQAAIRLVSCLERGTLAIQGPPGSGKTYTGARMIVRLLADGRREGISATSHKVIGNFLKAILEAAAEQDVEVRAIQKAERAEIDDPRLTVIDDNARVRDALAAGDCNLGAGTPWLWGREDFAGLVDVLFVDEAGQISLANVVAMGAATDSLVLLGDPQQLDQPLQGSHPPGADKSALAHLLGNDPTMPRERGLFLEHTWRMHPAITAFTSAAFYEDRLQSRDHLRVQALNGPVPVGGVGVRLLAAEHTGSDNDSPEEARQVATLVRALVEGGSTWVNAKGRIEPLTWEQVLVVAPYNAQVGEIQRLLPLARVGTVDKFQGQQAAVSIYSMTTSTPEDAPRGMDFLYSRNRLNVATSRARCVAVVVANPALLRVRARTPRQMRLANALCQFAEMATRP